MTELEEHKWQKLYQLAVELRKIKGWRYIEGKLIVLTVSGIENQVVVGAIGGPEYPIGMGFYTTEMAQQILMDDLNGMSRTVDDLSEPDASNEGIHIFYGDGENSFPQNYKLIKELDHTFKNEEHWLLVESHAVGRLTKELSIKEVEELTKILEALLNLMIKIKDKQVLLPSTLEKWLHSEYQAESQTSREEIKVFKVKSANKSFELTEQDHLILAKLAQVKKVNKELELTYYYTSETTKELYIPMFICVEKKSGQTLFMESVEAPENLEAFITSKMLAFISEYGRPKSIRIRLDSLGKQLKEICEKLEIKRILDDELDTLDEIVMDYDMTEMFFEDYFD